jgi:hypothetical protein
LWYAITRCATSIPPGQSQDDSERKTNVRLRRATACDLVQEVISGDNLLRALVNIADQERALEETLHDLQTIMPRYATGPYAKDEHMRTHTQADWEPKLDGAMHLNGRAHDLGTEAELTTEVEPVITLGDAKVNSSALGANAKTLNSSPEGPIGGPGPIAESESSGHAPSRHPGTGSQP